MAAAFINRFLNWFVIGLISPIMSLMILSRGVSLGALGVVVAIYSAVVIVLEFPSGVLSDLAGRKRVYLLSCGAAALGFGSLLFSRGPIPVALSLCLYGVSRAFSSGSLESLFIDEYIRDRGEEKLHSIVTAMSAGETLGLAAGALLGGLIPDIWGRAVPGADLYDGNIIAQLIVLATIVVLVAATVKERPPEAKPAIRPLAHIRETIAFVRGNRLLVRLLAGAAAWGFAFNAIELYWQPRLKSIYDAGAGTWLFGVLNSGYFAAALLGTLAAQFILTAGRRPFRRGTGLRMVFILRLATAGFIVALGSRGNPAGFAAVYLTMFFLNGMMSTPENTAVNAALTADKRSSVLSVVSLAVQLGGVLGGLLFSSIVERLGIPGVWSIAGAALGLSGLLYLGGGQRWAAKPGSPE